MPPSNGPHPAGRHPHAGIRRPKTAQLCSPQPDAASPQPEQSPRTGDRKAGDGKHAIFARRLDSQARLQEHVFTVKGEICALAFGESADVAQTCRVESHTYQRRHMGDG